MLGHFEEWKQSISGYLEQLLESKGREFADINPLGRDMCDRLYRFAAGGKMIRGGLVPLGYALFSSGRSLKNRKRILVQAGAAIELFQSAFLVHDDIMDRDVLRRNLGTIFFQYAEMAEEEGLSSSYHLGESLGICVGDVAFFIGFQILSEIPLRAPVHRQMLGLCAQEISRVGVAQMQDVYWSASDGVVTDKDIIKLYLNKTGRYSFSLPLMLGGLIAGQTGENIRLLQRLGEFIGVVFQIKDDELSDITEGKKTLFYECMRRSASNEERAELSRIYGKERVTEEQLSYIRDLFTRLGVGNYIAAIVETMTDNARSCLASLSDARPEPRAVLAGFLEYALNRTR
jgi:geranylgeranyl diphosphate synthase type I